MANKSLPNERVNKIGTPMKKTKSKNKKRQQAETKIVEEKHEQTGSSSKLLFCVCVIGIFTSYLIYGLIQEAFGSLRFKENENDPGKRFKFTTFTLFIQCIINALVSFIAIYVIKLTKKTNNTTSTSLGITRDAAKKFILLAITQSVAMMSSSKAVFYVSYPTQVIAKCCKPIPILITGLILKSSSYSKSRILSVVLITIGVTIFMYQNAVSSASAKASKGNKNNSNSDNNSDRGSLVGWWIGIGYLCVSLLADGFTGHFQNRIKDVHYKSMDKSISSWHMMLFSNVFSAAFFFVAMIVSQEAIPAIQFCVKFKTVIWLVLLSAGVSAIGQGFIFFTVTRYDSLVTSIVTTIRKFLSIILSVVWYGHKICVVQWVSVFIVFLGVGLGTVSDKGKKKVKKAKEN